MPAQFFSLFSDARADRRESKGLAITVPNNLMKFLLFMIVATQRSTVAAENSGSMALNTRELYTY